MDTNLMNDLKLWHTLVFDALFNKHKKKLMIGFVAHGLACI